MGAVLLVSLGCEGTDTQKIMEEVELKQYILDYSKSIAKGDDDVLEIAGRVSDFIEGKEDKCKNCTLVQWLWLILYLNVLLFKEICLSLHQEDEQPKKTKK